MRSLPVLCTLLLALGCSTPDTRTEAPAVGGEGLLSLERLHATRDFATQGFGPARWLADGGYTTLEPSKAAGAGLDVVRYDPESGERSVLVSADTLTAADGKGPLRIEDYHWSPDGRRLLVFTNGRRVWRQNTRGDYWVLDLASGRLRQLGSGFEPSTLMFAKFSPDGSRVAYVQAHDLWVEFLEEEREPLRLTSDGSETTINGTFDWVYEEELSCRDGFRWSPDGERIAYWQLDAEGVGVFQMIDNLAGLYSRVIPVQYPKVGTTNSACRVGFVSAEGGETTWVRLEGDPRQHYIARMEWAASSSEVVLQRLNRRQNELEVMLADADSGAARTILVERDEAWVDVVDDLLWIEDGAAFTWVSERDGWRHVYRVSRDGEDVRCLSPGEYDVVDVLEISERAGWILLSASPEDPTRRALHRVPLAGGPPERLTPAELPGTHTYQLAPDLAHAIHTASSFETPPVIDLVRLPDHESLRVLEDNDEVAARCAALERTPVEFFRVDVGEGVLLDGWCMKPPGFEPARSYPVLFHVYGEPWGQTVLDRWGGGNYLWHLMLTQLGYVVMSVDNRGTPAPRGRAWRKCIYGQIGVLASSDQAAAVRALRDRWSWIDPERVAIWGWSGGGSMTLNAMFRYPELYAAGLSVAPVPNQRYYDTIYQERYMGLPAENAAGYEAGSPVTFAERLEGDLLLVHGTADDNVHYQGTEELIDRLIAAGKQFTMMAYPGRSHSIHEGAGTRRHLFELLTGFLRRQVPPGPIPATTLD